MKMIFHSLVVVLLCAVGLQAHASVGGFEHDNGGDSCENTFKTVRDNLTAWIIKGGAKDLRFPEGVTLETYSRAMIRKMATAKIRCTEKPLFVGSAEKTCKNFSEADGSPIIQCNQNRFMATSITEKYILVHHEYAGLAGFEVNSGEASNYKISNQIIRKLAGARLSTVKLTVQFLAKMAVLSDRAPKDRAIKNNAICMFIGRINQGDIIQELYRDLVSLDGNLSSDVFPDSFKEFNKLRLNVTGLMNYCIEGHVPEDPKPIFFEDVLGLQARINEILRQLSVIENYLDRRFPYMGTP